MRNDLQGRRGSIQSNGAFGTGVLAPIYQLNANRDDSDSKSLADYAAIVWRQRTTVIAIVVTCTVLGILASRIQRPVYRSISSVLLEKATPALKLNEAEEPTSDANIEMMMHTEVVVLQSKTLLQRVLSKLNGRTWDDQPATEREREIAFAAEHLSVTPLKGTKLIKVQGESHDPQLASAIVNTLIEQYVQQAHEGSQKRNDSSGAWLHDQVNELRENIEGTERKLFEFARSSGLVSGSETTSTAEDRVRRLQEELAKAQVDRFGAQSRYEMLSSEKSNKAGQLADNAALREYESKLADLQRQLADVSSLFTPNHYKVKQLEAQIGILAGAADREREKALNQVSGDYTAALRREHLLSSEYHKAIGAVADQQNKSIHYNLLKRDLQRDRELYDAMIRSMNR